jgi:hypothetical protein
MTRGASRTSQVGDRVAAAVLLGVGAFVAVYARTLPYSIRAVQGSSHSGSVLSPARRSWSWRIIVFRRPASDPGGDTQLTRRSWALAHSASAPLSLIAPLG